MVLLKMISMAVICIFLGNPSHALSVEKSNTTCSSPDAKKTWVCSQNTRWSIRRWVDKAAYHSETIPPESPEGAQILNRVRKVYFKLERPRKNIKLVSVEIDNQITNGTPKKRKLTSKTDSLDSIKIYWEDSDFLLYNLLTEAPHAEPALLATYQKQATVISKYIGEKNWRDIFTYHCRKHHQGNWPYGHGLDEINENVKLSHRDYVVKVTSDDSIHVVGNITFLSQSCLIGSAAILDNRPTSLGEFVTMDWRTEPRSSFENPLSESVDNICSKFDKCPPMTVTETVKTRIGILDSGINYNSPYIAQSLVRPSPKSKKFLGYDFTMNDPFPYDDNGIYDLGWLMKWLPIEHSDSEAVGHGTDVAHKIISNAPGLAIIPIKIFSGIEKIFNTWQNRDLKKHIDLGMSLEKLERAIDYLAENGTVCINASLAFLDMKDYKTDNWYQSELIRIFAKHSNIVFILAAGNNGVRLKLFGSDMGSSYLAAFQKAQYEGDSIFTGNKYGGKGDLANVILVGGVDENNDFWSGSSFDKDVIHLSARAANVDYLTPDNTWKIGAENGTSFAAPLVSRTCGLIRHLNPDLSAHQVKDVILESAEKKENLMEYFQEGRLLSHDAALDMAKSF